jgi:putative two-component system response regulator
MVMKGAIKGRRPSGEARIACQEQLYRDMEMTKILVIDDEEPIRNILGQMLEMGGYDYALAQDALTARKILKDENFELILCDINMPGESGLEFIQYALAAYPHTAAVMVTALDDPSVAGSAMEIGVYGYIIKPFDRNGVLICVANALRRRQLEMDNSARQETLERIVADRTIELQSTVQRLRKALDGSIQAMALTVVMRDPYTAGHQQRVAALACAIGRELGLSDDQIDGLRMAATIHDIGKISIPAEILSKPGRINEIEFSLIKTHPRVGYDILKTIEFPWPIARVVLQHHERINGSGYPSGLPGEDILIEARILGVADVVEAMASHRPYRPALGVEAAFEEITQNRGTLYDSHVVDACLKVFREKDFEFEGSAQQEW